MHCITRSLSLPKDCFAAVSFMVFSDCACCVSPSISCLRSVIASCTEASSSLPRAMSWSWVSSAIVAPTFHRSPDRADIKKAALGIPPKAAYPRPLACQNLYFRAFSKSRKRGLSKPCNPVRSLIKYWLNARLQIGVRVPRHPETGRRGNSHAVNLPQFLGSSL